jgi:transposase
MPRKVAGIDVHRMLHVVTAVIEQPDGSIEQFSREFGGFKRDCRALAAWLTELGVEPVVMESTGIYGKSVHAHLENAAIAAWVVNAHFIKHVPGRKTDMSDSQWLAVLARFGLVNAVIRYILCECANAARMTKSSLASKYRSLMVRKSHKKAIVAVAHKMIRLIYVLLTRQQAYLDPQIDYSAMSAQKNAPRWIKQLKRIGKWPAPNSAPATASV